jgi:hypothetical protein
MVFLYRGKSTDKDMVRVEYFGVMHSDSEPEFGEDTEVYIGTEGTSEGAVVEEAGVGDILLLWHTRDCERLKQARENY